MVDVFTERSKGFVADLIEFIIKVSGNRRPDCRDVVCMNVQVRSKCVVPLRRLLAVLGQ
jgi:hypothetical protein